MPAYACRPRLCLAYSFTRPSSVSSWSARPGADGMVSSPAGLLTTRRSRSACRYRVVSSGVRIEWTSLAKVLLQLFEHVDDSSCVLGSHAEELLLCRVERFQGRVRELPRRALTFAKPDRRCRDRRVDQHLERLLHRDVDLGGRPAKAGVGLAQPRADGAVEIAAAAGSMLAMVSAMPS